MEAAFTLVVKPYDLSLVNILVGSLQKSNEIGINWVILWDISWPGCFTPPENTLHMIYPWFTHGSPSIFWYKKHHSEPTCRSRAST